MKITNEKLQDMANNPGNYWSSDDIKSLAQSLCELKSEYEIIQESYMCLESEIDKLRKNNKLLIEDAERLARRIDFEEPRDPIPHLVGRGVYYTCPECGGVLSYEDKVGRLACADCNYGWRKKNESRNN